MRAASRARAAVRTLSKIRLRDRRILIEVGHQPFVNSRVHDAVDLGVDELHLGLRFETRIRQLDAQTRKPNLRAHRRRKWLDPCPSAGYSSLRVLIDRVRQRGAKTGQMRSAVGIRNGVGEAKNLIVVAVVILQNDNRQMTSSRCREMYDRLRMNDLLVLAQAAGRIPRCRPCKETSPFSADRFAHPTSDDFKPGIQKCQFAQSRGQSLEFEFRRDGENRRIGHET